MTSTNHGTVIVVGGGGMGLSTAWRLAKGGHDVRVLEQFKFFHNRGSSHTEHRIIRDLRLPRTVVGLLVLYGRGVAAIEVAPRGAVV